MTTNTYLAFDWAVRWHDFWQGQIGLWIRSSGLQIAMLVIFGALAARFIGWSARKVTHRIDAEYQDSDQLVRTESAKYRQAVASVISWVLIALVFVLVATQITDVLAIPIGSLVAPAAVLGAALGFGAQKLVQDLLAGFFIITERQYGFGDLVQLNMLGAPEASEGTVEEVTLRVTKLRTTQGEVFTVPNGNIVRSLNMSKDWARAVIDIPVSVTADLNRVNDLLHEVCHQAWEDQSLQKLLLDEPALMGVESIEVDTVNVRIVARTLPGKQFDVGRRLRIRIMAALASSGIDMASGKGPAVAAVLPPGGPDGNVKAAPGGDEQEL
jgi:moderate conductance mechanosensitive channel